MRHGETGRLYPSGDIAAACAQVLETLHDTPEGRQRITAAAREFARQFQPAAAAERFIAALEKWSSEAGAPQETIPPLPAFPDARRVVVFPPSIPWHAGYRPQRWARTLAAQGCVVFYCDPQHVSDDAFTEIAPRIWIANVPLQAFADLKTPVMVLYSYNLEQVRPFADAQVIFEFLSPGEQPSLLEQEWLARAPVVTVSSEQARAAVTAWRPDAILVRDAEPSWNNACLAVLDTLEKTAAWENDPTRLKALLRWRENQVARLEAQIRDRDRPAVDILHGAVTEQKRILSERDKGIAFLRGEVAHRDRIIAGQQETIANLQM